MAKYRGICYAKHTNNVKKNLQKHRDWMAASNVDHIQFSTRTRNNTHIKQSPPSVGPAVVALDHHEALLGQALGSQISCHGPVVLHTLHVRATVDLLKVERIGEVNKKNCRSECCLETLEN